MKAKSPGLVRYELTQFLEIRNTVRSARDRAEMNERIADYVEKATARTIAEAIAENT